MKSEPLAPGRFGGSQRADGSKLFIQVLPKWNSAAGFFLDGLMVENELHFDISIKIELHIYI